MARQGTKLGKKKRLLIEEETLFYAIRDSWAETKEALIEFNELDFVVWVHENYNHSSVIIHDGQGKLPILNRTLGRFKPERVADMPHEDEGNYHMFRWDPKFLKDWRLDIILSKSPRYELLHKRT